MKLGRGSTNSEPRLVGVSEFFGSLKDVPLPLPVLQRFWAKPTHFLCEVPAYPKKYLPSGPVEESRHNKGTICKFSCIDLFKIFCRMLGNGDGLLG